MGYTRKHGSRKHHGKKHHGKKHHGKKHGGNPKKGQKSKTMKGRKDFTTKKSSKVFNRKGHYQKHAKGSRKMRRPYHKGGREREWCGSGENPEVCLISNQSAQYK